MSGLQRSPPQQMSRARLLWEQSRRQFTSDPEFRPVVIHMSAGVVLAAILVQLPRLLFTLSSPTIFVSSILGAICHVLFCLFYVFNKPVSMQAAALGWSIGLATSLPVLPSFLARHLFLFALFHAGEYIFTAICNRRSLRSNSFLLDHSKEYWIAAAAAWTEFFIESWLIPSVKIPWLSWCGVFLCLFGECLRKAAMLEARVGFTHKLAQSKRVDHRLVTSGVYAWMRHPGYAGWFLWSVGTQIVLCNPFCTICYTIVTWRFFEERIVEEERDLLRFFEDKYEDYQERVWIGIPFIRGYRLPTATSHN